MTRSVNEVQTLVAKAARGGGAPAGQAADFGRAAAVHLLAGRSEEGLIGAVRALPDGPILSLPVDVARVLENDVDGTAAGALTCAQAPDLARSYAEALPFLTQVTAQANGVDIQVSLVEPAARKTPSRLVLSDGFVQLLTTLAAKILVPESDASRLAGAGAGLTDND